jgi:hypothetical protein
MLDYPGVLSTASDAFGSDGPYVQGLARQAGLGGDAAIIVGLAVAVVLLVVASRLSEIPSLAVCCLACLAMSPVAWVFYAGILIVPLAAARVARAWWLLLPILWAVAWWHTPLDYGSAGLSVTALMLCVLVAVPVFWSAWSQHAASARLRL